MTMVRIYQPPKTATQSGKRQTNEWRVDFESENSMRPGFLMGWIPSQDTNQQLCLDFSSLEEALHFVRQKELSYMVCSPPQISMETKKYASNFTNPRIRGG